MSPADRTRSRRLGRREFLRVFLPIAATVAVATMGTALFLASQFMAQASRRLVEGEAERLGMAMRLFTRINLGSVPVFLSATAEEPVRNYLYARGSRLENALRAGERIDAVIVGNEFVDSIYLYNEGTGVLSTRSGLERPESPSDPALMGILSRVREFGLSRYALRRASFRGEARPRNLFTMVIGYKPEPGARMRSAFVANLSERRIREAITGAGTGGELYIVNEDGRFLSHPDADRFGELASADQRFAPILGEAAGSGSRSVRGPRGERFLATWVDQAEMRWRFVSLSPERTAFAPVRLIRDRILGAALLLLLAAVAAAFALSRSVRARERRADFAQAYLRGELEGDAGRGTMGEGGSRRLFPALRYPCACALLRVDGMRRAVAGGGGTSLFGLADELASLLGSASGGSRVLRVAENSFFALVAGNPAEARESIVAAASSVRERLGLGLGGWILVRPLSFGELPDAWHILHEAQRLDFLRGEGAIEELPGGLASEAREAVPASGLSDEGTLIRLDKAVRGLGGGPEAGRQVASLLGLLRECRDPELFRYAMAAAARRILAVLGESAEASLPGGAARFGASLAQAERLGEAEELFGLAALRLRERGDQGAERRQREIVARVKAIVDERLADAALSTAAIAAEVGLSASYLRDLFKRLEGVALYDHVGTRRLERAKALLVGSEDSVRGICDRTGFINYSYFFTFFKKSTGKTPTEFREAEARLRKASTGTPDPR